MGPSRFRGVGKGFKPRAGHASPFRQYGPTGGGQWLSWTGGILRLRCPERGDDWSWRPGERDGELRKHGRFWAICVRVFQKGCH